MRRIRQVLQLHFAVRASARMIAREVDVGRTTVQDYLARASAAGLGWPLPADLTDEALEQLLFPAPSCKAGARRYHEPDWAALVREMKRPGVSLLILWEEYDAVHPQGYRYSRFCELYREFERRLSPSMRQTHVAGHKVFVDYSGKKVAIADPLTGEVRMAEIFVAVLGASKLTYAEVTWTQNLADWIGAHVRMFRFWGSAPRLLVPDNLKSGVNKASFYEPEVNRTYGKMAAHYNVGILPTRPRKPKDKAMASYCTLFCNWHTDGREASWTCAAAAATLEDYLTWRHVPETAAQAVAVASLDETFSSPPMDGGFGDTEACCHLVGGKHTAVTEPPMTTG
jgi:transposase